MSGVARRVLLLDVMDTLVYDPFARELPAFFGLTLEELLACKHPTAWVDFELGVIDEATYHARFFADGRRYDAAALRAMLKRTYRYLDGIEPLLAELRAQDVEMHALSNYPTWFELIEESLALSRYVPWTFVSCKTGVRKPSALAYERAAASLGVPTRACVFVDDRVRNCRAAEAAGMHAIAFAGAEALREALVAAGVLRPEPEL